MITHLSIRPMLIFTTCTLEPHKHSTFTLLSSTESEGKDELHHIAESEGGSWELQFHFWFCPRASKREERRRNREQTSYCILQRPAGCHPASTTTSCNRYPPTRTNIPVREDKSRERGTDCSTLSCEWASSEVNFWTVKWLTRGSISKLWTCMWGL